MISEEDKCPNCAGKLSINGNKKICIYCDSEFYDFLEGGIHNKTQEIASENNHSFEKEKWHKYIKLNQGEIVKQICIDDICGIAAKLNIEITDKNQVLVIDTQKENIARKNFIIPNGEAIYLLHDSTIFGNVKKGFAICENGFYYRAEDMTCGVICWDLFSKIHVELEKKILKVGGKEFYCGVEAGHLYEVIITIIENLKYTVDETCI